MTVALPTASEITAALIAREELPPEKGDIGPQGLQGPDGQFGPPGPQGPKGDPGRNGVDGAPGDLGPIGPQGKQGDRGLKGDKGDKGDEGDRGEQGPIGPTGASGTGRSFFPRGGGGSSSGSGLPSGGTVGQVVTNTAPGAGDWEEALLFAKQTASIPNFEGGIDGGLFDKTKAASTDGAWIGAQLNDTVSGLTVGHGAGDITTDGTFLDFFVLPGGATSTEYRSRDPDDNTKSADLILGTNTVGTHHEGRINISEDGTSAEEGAVPGVWIGWKKDNRSRIAIAAAPDSGAAAYTTYAPVEVYDEAGVSRARIGADGAFVTAQHAAPDDSELSAGECSFWFDQTNGASALKIKGKSADGTIVTATIPLT